MTTFGGERSDTSTSTSTSTNNEASSSSSANGCGQFGSSTSTSNNGTTTNFGSSFGTTGTTTGIATNPVGPLSGTTGGFDSTSTSMNTTISTSTDIIIDTSTPFLATADGNIQLLQESLQQLNLLNTGTSTIQCCIDSNGYTLLHAASSYNHLFICQWIIQQCQSSLNTNTNTTVTAVQSYINSVDNDGDSALHYCTTKEMAQYLIEVLHIDSTIQNKDGQTAVQCKVDEYQEYITDEDYDETNIHPDCILVKELILYLQSLQVSTIAQ